MACSLIRWGGDQLVGGAFEGDEVHEAVNSLNIDKASGLDGYTMVFFQASGVVIKE